MIKSILVAVDDSSSSRSALSIGAELSKLSGAKLKGLYVEDTQRILGWDAPEFKGSAIGGYTTIVADTLTKEQIEVEKEVVEEGKKLQKEFDTLLAKHKIQGFYSVIRGHVAEMLLEASKTVDLVLIGRRGKEHNESLRKPGPTTDSILHKVAKPVIVVPPEASVKPRILIAYDGSESAQRAMSFAVEMIKLLKSETSVFSISDNEKDAKSLLLEAREFLTPHDISASYDEGTGSYAPCNGIVEHAKAFKPGLIVMGVYGQNRNNFIKMIFGSTTEVVLTHESCPVLLCK